MAHMNDVRAALLETLRDLRASTGTPAEIAKAKAVAHVAVAHVAAVLVDSARVEVEFLRATDSEHSAFLAPSRTVPVTALPTVPVTALPTAHNPFPQ